MPTLILTPRFTDDAQALWRAAGQRGWHVERVHGWRVSEHLLSAPDPVLYVEALMAPLIAEQLGLRLLQGDDDWLPRLPWKYRKRDVRLTTLGQAKQLSAPAFVKPPNDKSFAAKVYAPHELPGEFPDDMPVLIQEPVTWETEFRCFVLHRELRTFPVYLRDGELQREAGFSHSSEEEREVRAFVNEVLADNTVDLPRATVLDVGTIAGRGWAVVEQNAAWGAGLYECDPDAVLDVLQLATERIG